MWCQATKVVALLVKLLCMHVLAILAITAEETLMEMQCDVDTSGPICLGGQEQLLLPNALQGGLIGFWNFDKSQPIDVSGNRNHGVGTIQAGPSMAGQGSSAFFHQNFLEIPGAAQFHQQDFTYAFWVYLINDGGTGSPHEGFRICPILRKGLDKYQIGIESMKTYAATPAVLFDRITHSLRVEIATGSTDSAVAEAFESNARLKLGRWYHLAVVRLDSLRSTRLYVNGILDSSQSTPGYLQVNDEGLFVGSDPLVKDKCNVPMYVDNLKVYNRAVSPDEIQAEASPALNGIEPSFIRLACVSCSLETAVKNCPEGYHVCSSLELHMGGYQVARILGWLNKGTHVWSHSSIANSNLQQRDGLGVKAPAPAMQETGKGADGIPPVGMESAPAPQTQPTLGLGLCCASI